MTTRTGPTPSSSSTGRWYLASIRLRGFKSFGRAWVTAPLPSSHLVGILGPNGGGKSNLLEAVLFAVGCPATVLRVRTLRELASSDAPNSPCEVELTMQKLPAPQQHQPQSARAGGGRKSGGAGARRGGRGGSGGPLLESHVLRTSLAPDGAGRVFQLDGRVRTAQQIKDFLTPKGLSLDSGSAAAAAPRVIRQAQVTALADGNDASALAALVGSASGLVRWREETRRAREELGATRGALREIQGSLERLQAAVRHDDERLAAASRLASLELEVAAVGGELAATLERWVCQIQKDLRANEALEREAQADVHRLEAAAATAEEQRGKLVLGLEGMAAATDIAAAAADPSGKSGGGFGIGAARRRRRGPQEAASSAAATVAAAAAVGPAPSGGSAAASPAAAVAVLEQQLAVEVEKVRLGERQLEAGRALRQAAAAAAARQAAAAAQLRLALEAEEREAARLGEREGLLEEISAVADAAAAAAQYEEHLVAVAADSAAEVAAAREHLAAAERAVRCAEEVLAAARGEAVRLQAKADVARPPAAPDPAEPLARERAQGSPEVAATTAATAAAAAATVADAAATAAEDAAGAVRATQRDLAQIRVRADALRRALQLSPPPLPSHRQPSWPSTPYRRLYQCFTLRTDLPVALTAEGGGGDGDDGDGGGGGWAVRPWPPYLHALSLIAGANLHNVLICDTAAAAARVVEDPRLATGPAAGAGYGHGGGGGGKLRLWPLDRLRPSDSSGAQRRAQRELAAQGLQAWLPLDLLAAHDTRAGPALLRAFGRQLVAADDAAAAALASRFGLSSVTLAGSVSHRGVLTGGWDGGGDGGGPAAAGRQLLERLWELSELGRLEVRLAARLEQQQAAAGAAERRRAEAEEAALSALEAQSRALAAQQRIKDLDEQLAVARRVQQDAATAAAEAEQEDGQNQQALLRHRGSGAGNAASGSGGGVYTGRERGSGARRGLREDLAAEVGALRERVGALAAARGEAQRAAEATEAEAEAAEVRAAGAAPEVEAEAQLQERRQLVQNLERRLAEARAAVEAAARWRQELEAAVAAVEARVAELRAEGRRAAAELRAQQEALTASRAALKRVTQERDTVRREYGSSSSAGGADVDGGNSGGSSLGGRGLGSAAKERREGKAQQEEKEPQAGKGCEAAAAALRSRLRALQMERARLEDSQVPPAQLLQFQERVAAVAVLQERAISLAAAADMLQAGIEQSTDQVLAANAAVFYAVRRRFTALCVRLLPALDLDLVAPCGCASRGVVVRFRRRRRDLGNVGEDAAAAAGGEGGWSDELGQLSGGQRTLVSVALLLGLALAVNSGGGGGGEGGGNGGGGGLFLLDEVDAALDEHNQAAVAALLRYLSHRGQGCQVLAVTHNAAFQAACEGFVRVSRGLAGTQVEATGAATAPPREGTADPRVTRPGLPPAGATSSAGPSGPEAAEEDAAGGAGASTAAKAPTAKKAKTTASRRM